MFRQRLITALILLALAAALFFLPLTYFYPVITLITLLAAWEWSRLMDISLKRYRFLYVALVLFCMNVFVYVPLAAKKIFFAASLWWVFAAALIGLYPRASRWWSKGIFWRGLMGLCVLVPCWAAVNYIRYAFGVTTLLLLFILIWTADISAYLVGKKWGKHRLAPHVSPKKSWEGAVAAFITSIIIPLIVLYLSPEPSKNALLPILLCVITVIFSIIGDLFESMLKRQVNIKDSGNWLPGHGGVLDRLDSLMAAAPVFAFGAILISMM